MKKFGFTLAEALIAIAIIAIVAALTIPTLVRNYQEKVIVTKLEKFYSVMSKQIQMNIAREIDDPFSKENLLSNFSVNKICPPSDTSCATEIYRYYNGDTLREWGQYDNSRSIYYYAVLSDGMILRYNKEAKKICDAIYGTTKQLQSVCNFISVDLNGNRKPNTLGKDVFSFYITEYGLIPYGTPENNSTYGQFKDCKTWGYGCTYYVLKYKTLNYDKYKL